VQPSSPMERRPRFVELVVRPGLALRHPRPAGCWACGPPWACAAPPAPAIGPSCWDTIMRIGMLAPGTAGPTAARPAAAAAPPAQLDVRIEAATPGNTALPKLAHPGCSRGHQWGCCCGWWWRTDGSHRLSCRGGWGAFGHGSELRLGRCALPCPNGWSRGATGLCASSGSNLRPFSHNKVPYALRLRLGVRRCPDLSEHGAQWIARLGRQWAHCCYRKTAPRCSSVSWPNRTWRTVKRAPRPAMSASLLPKIRLSQSTITKQYIFPQIKYAFHTNCTRFEQRVDMQNTQRRNFRDGMKGVACY